MRIRKYKNKDEKQVKELINKVTLEFFGRSIITQWEDFNDYALFLVVEKKGQIIGSVALKDKGNRTGMLKRMYIYKEFRKQGLGQQLFNKILEFAKKHNYTKILLSTEYFLTSAVNFYRKNGFVKIDNPNFEEDFPDLLIEDIDLKDTLCMERRLS